MKPTDLSYIEMGISKQLLLEMLKTFTACVEEEAGETYGFNFSLLIQPLKASD